MAEFSRPLPLGRVGPEGRHLVLEASAGECEALARRLGILGVEGLRVELDLRQAPAGAAVARGRLSARVTQECVITLEPVGQAVEEEVALRLLPLGQEPADGPEDMDEIAAGPGGVVDLGEAMAEQLALALDPYPRAPGASLPAEVTEAGEGSPDAAPEGAATQETSGTPFAALAALRRPRG